MRSEPRVLMMSGRFVNPLAVQPSDVLLDDVAHGLALINRFNGQTQFPVQVAYHAVCVSRLMEGTGLELQALHHDDGEAYVGDMTKWLKESSAMKAFRDAEEQAQRACYLAFRIPEKEWNYPHLMHPDVEAADKIMVRLEGERGYGPGIWQKWHEEYAKSHPPVRDSEIRKLGPWGPVHWHFAKKLFLERHEELVARRAKS